MKIQTLEILLEEYKDDNLEKICCDREIFFAILPYSLIVEGCFLEWDNLELWLTKNFEKENNTKWRGLFHGKSGYDYGFFEFFFANLKDKELLVKQIPFVYGYVQDYGKKKDKLKFRTEGYDTHIDIFDRDEDG